MTLKLFRLRIKRFGREKSGIAATEFAIIAPMFLFSLLIMADFGLAITQKMSLDHTVRSGAEYVMAGVTDTSDLRRLMEAAASGVDSRDADDVTLAGLPLVDAVMSCRCARTGEEVACASVCANQRPAYVFYSLSAQKTYDAMFIADRTLRSEIDVQTR